MQLDESVLAEVLRALCNTQRVFVTGQGRSGLMMRMFAMRLMHLGLPAYVIGDTITPPAQPGDIMIAASGSGETAVTCLLAEKALHMGLILIAFTTVAQSQLGRLANYAVVISAPTKEQLPEAQADTQKSSIQLMGALFEQQLHLLCDALCMEVARLNNIQPSIMWARHANLE
jgi:6-phospho-3-hexuloisomerase